MFFCTDEHHLDGIQPVRHAAKGGVPIRTNRLARLQGAHETSEVHRLHSADTTQYCVPVPGAAQSTLRLVLHLYVAYLHLLSKF